MIALLLACTGPDPVSTPPDVQAEPVVEQVPADVAPVDAPSTGANDVVGASNALAQDLWGQLGGDAGAVFSPMSIETALAMTLAGTGGETEALLANALHLGASPHGDMAVWLQAMNSQEHVTLVVANAIWPHSGLDVKPSFVTTVKEQYAGAARALDYSDAEAARQVINGWVSDRTQENIPDLLPEGSVTGDTRMVLTNAVYLKAKWADPFDGGDTRDAPFTLADGTVVQVPTLSAQRRVQVSTDPEWTVLRLPYRGGDADMVVAMPSSADALASADLAALSARADAAQWQESALLLPKWEQRASSSLNAPLRALGLGPLFEDGADFSNMTSASGLRITDVVHEAWVKVDEAGTEAAAATGVVVGIKSMPPPAVPLVIDQPFVFMVRHQGAILFVGRVDDPR